MYIKMQPTLTKPERLPQAFSRCGLGGVGLEGVEVLAGLGLTGRQARAYLALLRAGDAKARVVASVAGVPRQEVYGLLLELQQLGLVRQNLTVPVSYAATPLSEAVKMLFEQKANELTLMSQKAKHLTKKLDQTPRLAMITAPPKPCFGSVSEGERGKKYQIAIEQTQHTIDALISWTRFKQLCFHFEAQLKDALKKGVAINIVTEKPTNHHLPKWVNPTLLKYPNFTLKTTLTPPDAAVTIFDHTQAAIAFNPSIRLTKGPDLWTSHPALTAPYQIYFNTIWAKTKNCPLK
jgi:sugar-specific transcriptional regulator TrmB